MRLIRDAFAVRECLGDPRVVPGFHCTFLPGMPPPMSPGEIEVVLLQFLDSDIGLRRGPSSPVLPSILPSVSSRARISGLTGSHSLRPVRSLAPLTDLTRISPGHKDFYVQAFHELVTLLAAGYNYDSDWTSSAVGLSPTGMYGHPRCTGPGRGAY